MAGARGKYDPNSTPKLVFELTLKYATDLEICEALGIHPSTYYDWLNEKTDLSDTISRAKQIRAQKLIPKLQKRANGFRYTETTQELNQKTGKMVTTKKVSKMIPPDVTALKFFLTNALPDEFKNRQDLDLKGKVDTGAQVTFYIPDNGRDDHESEDSE